MAFANSCVVWIMFPPIDDFLDVFRYLFVLAINIWLFYFKLSKHIKTRYDLEHTPTTPKTVHEPSPNTSNKSSLLPSKKVCEAIWLEVDQYVKYADPDLDHRSQLYLWGIYFYMVVKSINNQSFVDEIYSHFDECASKRIIDPTRRSHVTQILRKYYREIRVPLIQSKITPYAENGLQQLWLFSSYYLYGDSAPPPKAKERFMSAAKFLNHISAFYYSRSFASSNFSTVRYSISESNSEIELPNE